MKWLREVVKRNRIERSLTKTELANLESMVIALAEATPGAYAGRMIFDYNSATATVTITMEVAVKPESEAEIRGLNRRSTRSRHKARSRMAHDAAISTLLCQPPRRMNVAYAIAV